MKKSTLKDYYLAEANAALKANDWDRASEYAAKARRLDEPEREIMTGQASLLDEDWEVERPLQRGLFD